MDNMGAMPHSDDMATTRDNSPEREARRRIAARGLQAALESTRECLSYCERNGYARIASRHRAILEILESINTAALIKASRY